MVKLKEFIAILMFVFITAVFLMIPGSILVYCMFALLSGCFLGGMYNKISAIDIMVFSHHKVRNIDYLTNFNIGIGSIFSGLLQIVIGLVISGRKQEDKLNEINFDEFHQKIENPFKSLFYVLLVLGGIGVVLFFLRMKSKIPQEQNDKELVE